MFTIAAELYLPLLTTATIGPAVDLLQAAATAVVPTAASTPEVPSTVQQTTEAIRRTAVTLAPYLGVFVARLTLMLFEVGKLTFTSQGRRVPAAAFATIDAALWLTIAVAIIANPTIGNIVAYAAGVGAGTWVGLWILNGKLKIGIVTVRIYARGTGYDTTASSTPDDPTEPASDTTESEGPPDSLTMTAEPHSGTGHPIAAAIRHEGFGATVFDGHGRHGPVQLVMSSVKRKYAGQIVDLAHRLDPDAFIAVDNHPAPGSHINGVHGPRRL